MPLSSFTLGRPKCAERVVDEGHKVLTTYESNHSCETPHLHMNEIDKFVIHILLLLEWWLVLLRELTCFTHIDCYLTLKF